MPDPKIKVAPYDEDDEDYGLEFLTNEETNNEQEHSYSKRDLDATSIKIQTIDMSEAKKSKT